MLDTSSIFEYRFHNPQQNFPNRKYQETPEARFAELFSRSYRDKFNKIHSGTAKQETLFVREVPVAGNGIADLLVLSWSCNRISGNHSLQNLEKHDPTVRAFEFKMSNWRVGMMQAHRYKYFSHASILVLPKPKLKCAESHLNIFRTLHVGLWGFAPETGSIICLYTPRPKQQQIPKYGRKAIQLSVQAACL